RATTGDHRPWRWRLHDMHPGFDRTNHRREPQMTSIEELNPQLEGLGRYEFGWADSDDAGATAERGLNEAVVRNISGKKDEPDWMLQRRLKGLKMFGRKPLPTWGAELDGIDFDKIKYFVRSTE